MLNFNIVFHPEPEGGFTVTVPSLPGCVTYGKTIEEAKKMATDAISLYIDTLKEDGEPIPSDSENFTTFIPIEIPKETKPAVYV